MGDARYERHYDRVRSSADPTAEIQAMDDGEIIQALAAASRGPPSPYLANVLASEALNRLHRARLVHDHIAEGIFILDGEGRIVEANPAARRMLGLDLSDLRGRPLAKLCVHDPHDEGHLCDFLRALREGTTVLDGEEMLQGADAKPIRVAYTAAPTAIPGEAGVVVAWRNIGVAAAQRQKLVESEARYRSLFENSPDLIISLDREGRVTELNPAGERIGGVSSEAVRGRTLLPFLSAADQARAHAILAGVFTGKALNAEFRVPLPDGSERIYDALGVPIVVDGEVVGVHGVARNVTHLRALEEEVRTREARHRLISRGVRDHAILLLKPHGEIGDWNPGAEAIFGWSQDEILGSDFSALFEKTPTTQAKVRLAIERSSRGEHADLEAVGERADGTAFYASGVLNAVHDSLGGVTGHVAVLRNASARRRSELRLRRALAMAEACERAHDDLDEGVIRLVDGTIQHANRAALHMIGLDRDEVVGQRIGAFLAPGSIVRLTEALHGPLDEGSFPLRFLHAQGAAMDVDARAWPVMAVEGAPHDGFVLILRRRDPS